MQPNAAGVTDTLAAAYAANNQFDLAISHQTRALALAEQERWPDITELEYRLALYQNNQTWSYTSELPED